MSKTVKENLDEIVKILEQIESDRVKLLHKLTLIYKRAHEPEEVRSLIVEAKKLL